MSKHSTIDRWTSSETRHASLTVADARDKITEYLIDTYNMNRDKKFMWFYMSQSLWNVCSDLDGGAITDIDGHGSISERSDQGTAYEYTSLQKEVTDVYSVNYESGYDSDSFNVDGVRRECERSDIRDICVNNVTIRVENDGLYEDLYDILDITGVYDMQKFEKPIYVELSSESVSSESVRSWMKNNHPPGYFSTALVDGEEKNMKWKYNILRVDNIWSRNARIDDPEIIAYDSTGDGMTVRDLESQFINHHAVEDRSITPINSRIINGALRNVLDSHYINTQELEWTNRDGWYSNEW